MNSSLIICLIQLMIMNNSTSELKQPNYLDILTPHAVISTTQHEVYLVGKTNAPIVEVYINGKKYFDYLTKDSMFHALLRFGYGLNEIEIRPIYSGISFDVDLFKTIEIMYSPETDRKMTKLYTPYSFHQSELKKACYKCHQVDFDEFKEIDDETVCTECHSKLKERFSGHTDVDNRTCINCHQLGDALVSSFFNNDAKTNPCFRCHSDKIKQFDQEFIHGPVAGGSCTICHDPHGSQYEKSLKVPEQILCTSCHEDIEDEYKKETVHKPFEQGYCTQCHDPHSTSNKWVLVKRSEQLCMNCHNAEEDLKWHKHPYNVKPKKKLKMDLTLNKEGYLECISCHNPHATNTKNLLRIKNDFACVGCHTDR